MLLIQHIFVSNREDDESSLVKGKQVKVVKSGSSVILDGYIRRLHKEKYLFEGFYLSFLVVFYTFVCLVAYYFVFLQALLMI